MLYEDINQLIDFCFLINKRLAYLICPLVEELLELTYLI